MTLYLIDGWAKRPDAPSLSVIDTRGQGGKAGGAWAFFCAFIRVFWRGIMRETDLVYAHMSTRGSTLRKCVLCPTAQMFGIPVIMHMHGADFFEFYRRLRPVFQRVTRHVLRNASFVIVLGKGWRDFLIDELGLEPERVVVVANGVRRPDSAPRYLSQPANRQVRIVFLGRLGDRKGVPELIAALTSPELRARAWTAAIAGDGEIDRFRSQVRAAGMEDRIEIPGWLDRAGVVRLLAQADILVLPSHHEAMPIAVLEGLAFGAAVVTTPVGSVPEILTDNESAVLVQPGDIPGLIAGLVKVIDSEDDRVRIAAAGHRVFLERLDQEKMANAILELFHNAIGSDPNEGSS
jgi:glycosyltransferase involved in cell wall biosynthesis